MKSKMDRMEGEIASLRTSNVEFSKHHQRTMENQKREYDQRISELTAERSQAINDGDGQKFTIVDDQINDLRTTEQQPVEDPRRAEHDRMTSAWVQENKWYDDRSSQLRWYVDSVAGPAAEREGYTGQAYLSELTRRAKEKFPEEFDNPARTQPASVDTGGTRQDSTPQPKTFASLPDDAKAAFARFAKDNVKCTEESYAANYDWD